MRPFSIMAAWLLLSIFSSVDFAADDNRTRDNHIQPGSEDLKNPLHVRNGSFEDATPNGKPAGWTISARNPEQCVIDGSTAADGKKSMKLTNTGPENFIALTQLAGSGKLADFPAAILVRVWVKTENITDNPAADAAFFGIWASTKEGKNAFFLPVAHVRGTMPWKEYSRVIEYADIEERCKYKTVPENWALRANLYNQSGAMWIDNITIESVLLPPLQVTLDANEYLSEQTQARLTLIVSESALLEAKTTATIEMVNNAGKTLSTQTALITARVTPITLRLSDLPAGSYKIKVALHNEQRKEITCVEASFTRMAGPFE